MENKYAIISHVREDLSSIQTNADHSVGVACLANKFASKFGMGSWGNIMGLLHDKGKERTNFQNYIRKISGLDPQASWFGEDKTHAFIGAVLANKLVGASSSIIGYPIMGHHAGLHDYIDYEEGLKKEIPKEIGPIDNEFQVYLPKHILGLDKGTIKRGLNHLIRMMFSCLVDADYLDTEKFMSPQIAKERGTKNTLTDIKVKFNNYLKVLSEKAPTSPLNKLRKKILEKCLESSELPVGFYSLSVPTGGGKTISSFAWALNHALKNELERIIIAIPYTSIITQTANVLRSIFGEGCVLEHHSDFDIDNVRDEKTRHALKLATENWDYPIIVTTNVQLLESIYSNKSSKCRKLHNIAKSVIIMDEIQSLPLEHIQPIIDALVSYNKLFSTSILFSTASLPALNRDIISSQDISRHLRGIDRIQEIIPIEWELHKKLRRVTIEIADDKTTIENLSKNLSVHSQVLCIVNSRKIAKEIYEHLPKDKKTLHLSRMMCSAHISNVIEEIKQDLLQGLPLLLIATQLIEAGVDIDFPIVYRQEAGLDSILQAAGRCNREGKLKSGKVTIFRLKESPVGSIGKATNAWDSLPRDADWLDPEVMTKYFIQLYSRTPTFDKSNIAENLYKPENWLFKTASDAFRLIDADGTKSVIVNYGDSASIINELKSRGPTYQLLKKLSRYSVTLHQKDFNSLVNSGLVEEVSPGIFYIYDSKQYNEKTGLIAESHWQEEILII